MNVKIAHTLNPGIIRVPASKSLAQRFILASALASEKTTLLNTGNSEDVLHMLDIAQKLGAVVHAIENGVEITPGVNPVSNLFNAGESGLGVRLLLPVLAAKQGKYTIKGKGSLNKRPMDAIIRFLEQNGVTVHADDGFLPITLEGKLRGGKLEIDGSKSSQYISGLLMALPFCETDSELTVTNLSSKPYVDLTMDVLNQFGIAVDHRSYQQFFVRGNQSYIPKTGSFTIEGDYSGTANWMVAGAIGNHAVTMHGLKKNSLQGDAKMLDALNDSGAKIQWNEHSITVSKSENNSFEFNATDCPDLFPPLVILAAAAKGTSVITGASRLIDKESNRAQVLQTEFGKLGLKIKLDNDVMQIEGTGTLLSGTIHSNNDHRIAMAGAIAALLTNDSVTIEQAEAVAKSYPEFWIHCGIN